MKNLLLLLKIFDSDFKLNYKKILSFINLGIFLCWGCLIAAFITGAFESRLENRISSKNSFALYKLSLLKMQNTFLKTVFQITQKITPHYTTFCIVMNNSKKMMKL